MTEYKVINGGGERTVIAELRAEPIGDAEWVTPGPEIFDMDCSLGTFLGIRIVESETVLQEKV